MPGAYRGDSTGAKKANGRTNLRSYLNSFAKGEAIMGRRSDRRLMWLSKERNRALELRQREEGTTMRDEFTPWSKDLLSRRAGHMCSNPRCRRPTSGPQQDPSGAVNIGVAAHISAASPGGPRYDATMSEEQRRDVENGIWLCQVCAKLVDSDAIAYPVALLRQWRGAAEGSAKRDLEHRWSPIAERAEVYRKLERQMPDLLTEMRKDIAANPLWREFVVLKRAWLYNSHSPYLAYYYDEHEHLESQLDILENYGLIRDATWNNTKRYKFSEEFIDYLEATGPPSSAPPS